MSAEEEMFKNMVVSGQESNDASTPEAIAASIKIETCGRGRKRIVAGCPACV